MVLKALVLRPLLREKIRTALTVLGIAVGVAVVVAIQLSNQSALRAFRESVNAVAGRANYQIVSEATPLSEDTLLGLQPLWREGVRFAPVIDVEGMVEPAQLPVRLLAVDLLSDLHFRDYKYAKVRRGSFDLFADDAVIVPAPFAKEHGLAMGSPLTLNILGQTRRMTVRGILEAQGPATAFNGAIVVCDIATAQKAFGMTGRLTRIDLMVPDDELLERIHVPPGARVERPSRRNERVEKMLRAFRVNLFALAGVALLVGMFLVYNTVLISILRRRRDVGVLKTLGASPRQIFGAFVAEGLLFGAIGSGLGVALGNGLAFAILGLIGKTINSLYVTSRPEAIVLTPEVIAIGFAVGMVLSFVSAVQPSLEAARERPGAFIKRGAGSPAGPGRLRVGPTFCFVVAALVARLPPYKGIAVAGYISVLLVVIGFSLLAPAVIKLIAKIPLPFGIVGRLASASLPASLRRTSIASAALSIAIGMMVAVALMVGSFRETVHIWVDQTVSSDLWLRPAKGLSNAGAALFPPQIADELRRVPFVAAFDRARGRDIVIGDSLVTVGSGDFDVAARFGNLPMVAPRDSRAAIARARREHGVVVSESFSTKFGKGVNDTVEIPGAKPFRITGVYRDYSNDRGTIVMDREDYVRAFRDDAINTIVVYLEPGITREEARRRLEAQFGPKYHAFAVTNGEIRSEVMRIFDQTFLITYALLGVAIVVAVLGIVNTLAALILERTRELALLRVTGMSVGQTRAMIVLESSLLGLAATVVGVAMGYALSWILINVINKQSFGWTIEFHTPVLLIAASLAVTFVASALAGLLPARLAERIHIASAIKSE
ncbi:MAG TPA: FtsX-like permease family protein [Thermoanaerobaculia bacterium]|jgi:putative ABC transport system permease protein|nr:FtsX-like permease family protein [Thermoanaerobaculia bacterium]